MSDEALTMGARARNLAKAWLLGALGFAALCAWIASILAAWHDGRYADMRLHLMDTEECLLHVPVLLCLWSLLFRGGYSASSVGGSVLAATVMERFYIIPKHLHDFLELNHYYPSCFYHGGPHVNAQYALTLCYVAVGVPFIASLVRRRTMDKTYMAVVGAVAVLTTVLFHLVVVELGLDNTMAEERKAKLDTMSVLAYAPTTSGDGPSRPRGRSPRTPTSPISPTALSSTPRPATSWCSDPGSAGSTSCSAPATGMSASCSTPPSTATSSTATG